MTEPKIPRRTGLPIVRLALWDVHVVPSDTTDIYLLDEVQEA